LRDERKIGDDEGWESLSLSSFYQENRVLGSRAAGGVLRWKSQRKKIHRLAYSFSIDFKIYRLAYGFLCVNHKGLAKVSRFLVRIFFSQDFKNP
jgi:hypothetical protein